MVTIKTLLNKGLAWKNVCNVYRKQHWAYTNIIVYISKICNSYCDNFQLSFGGNGRRVSVSS